MSLPDAIDGKNGPDPTPKITESSNNSSASQSSTVSELVLCKPGEEIELPVLMAGETDETNQLQAGGVKEYYCGIGRCRPKWMQVFRNAKFFTFILCLNCIIEGAIVSGFTSVVLSTIERRYRFPSVWAGLIASVFDMAVLVSVLFISYFGGRGHKPRWLGIGLIIQGAGAFVFSLPQFVLGRYDGNSAEQFEVCPSITNITSDCTAGNNIALVFFFSGNILIGIGAAPLFTVGTSYLDDIVSPKYVSIHLGIFYTFAVIGPAVGYLLGGYFLSFYVDPWVETSLEPSNPAWVGAWWMCFIFSGAISWLFAIPFFLFPKLLPNSSSVKAERMKEMAQKYDGKDSGIEEVDLALKVKSFPQHMKLVLKTPSWIFITAAICFSSVVVSGVASFAPKYLESQFGLTASRASFIAGGIAIPSGGAGVFIGGLIIFFTKSKGRSAALINWIVTLLALFPMLVFLVHCPTLELVGVTVEYPDGSLVPSPTSTLNASCIAACNCNSNRFEPICGLDGYTYFSPCRAGCQTKSFDNDTMDVLFHNCSCIAEQIELQETGAFSLGEFTNSASDGICDQGCNNLGLFLAVLFFALILIFILQVPNIIITIRSVADEQRTLALGAQSVAFRAFGTIPGPIVFGAIFDSACIYWQSECSRRGNCWVYNNTLLSRRAVILTMMGIGANFIFSFLSWFFYPKTSVSGKDSPTPPTSSTGHSNNSSEYSYRPSKRLSSQRMDSHCSEDILLDSDM